MTTNALTLPMFTADEYSARASKVITFYERNPDLELALTKKVSCLYLGDALRCRQYWRLVYIESVSGMPFFVLYWKDEPVYKVGLTHRDRSYQRTVFARIGRRLAEFGWDATAHREQGGACWVSTLATRRRLRRLV